MKVLAVTGRLAQDLVRAQARGHFGWTDVLVLETDVAAFITPEMLLNSRPEGYDLILIPGSITADFSRVEEALGEKIRLGPKNAADLGFVLSHIGEVELSTEVPACVLLEASMRSRAREKLGELEASATGPIVIGGVKIGGSSRMKVLAEVVDSTRLSPERLMDKIRHFEGQGADMIDLGLPLDARPEEVVSALNLAKECTNLPISIDTLSPELIMSGLEAGADLVLSLDGRNIPLVGKLTADAGVPAVVIPGPGTITVDENLEHANALGIRAIADPVLSPPLMGMGKSISRYLSFKESHPDVPLFFGIGNATELIDADSQGANAILAAIGQEVGASVIFTPEYSDKARGSVRELRTASEMMLLARERKSPPKDLGLDLLVLKEKRRFPGEIKVYRPVEAKSGHGFEPDPAGRFVIGVSGGLIVAKHRSLEVVGKSARDIMNTLIDRGLVTRLDHAGYLGRELQKAEIALTLGRSYIQDEPIFLEKR